MGPDFASAKIQCTFATIPLITEPIFRVIDLELGAQKIIAMIIIHAKGKQRFAP